jgi:hypothetical protein
MRHHFKRQVRLNNQLFNNGLYGYIVLCFLVLLLVGVNGCKSKEVSFRHYKKIAADIAPRSNEKRNIIAQVANSEFPQDKKTEKKDSVVTKYVKVIDNKLVNSLKSQLAKLKAQQGINVDSLYTSFYDSVLNGIPPCETIERWHTKTETIKDTIGNYFREQVENELISRVNVLNAKNTSLNKHIEDITADLNNISKEKSKWKIRFFALLAAIILGGIGYGYYKLKQSFKIIPQ